VRSRTAILRAVVGSTWRKCLGDQGR
jgi:hypothetical protein